MLEMPDVTNAVVQGDAEQIPETKAASILNCPLAIEDKTYALPLDSVRVLTAIVPNTVALAIVTFPPTVTLAPTTVSEVPDGSALKGEFPSVVAAVNFGI